MSGWTPLQHKRRRRRTVPAAAQAGRRLTDAIVRPSAAAVIGATGGIGRAMVERIAASGRFARVYALSRSGEVFLPPIRSGRLDLADEASIADAAAAVGGEGPVGLVIIATGLLHADGLAPDKTWRTLDPDRLARAFAVNAIGPALVAKHFLPLLPRSGRAVFAALSARVGSIEDNRLGGWYGYRASKAALNQFVRTLAVELARSHPDALALALHPGTVETELSRPFRAGIGAEGLFSPALAAEHLLRVIDTVPPDGSGQLWGWDGRRISF